MSGARPDLLDTCPAGWSATDRSPSCNYTGGHYCIRPPFHQMPHRCECDATTSALSALPPHSEDGIGHCAGPSWFEHPVSDVPAGEACPTCGTVML